MEDWKWVEGFEGSYQVSNLGNVRSVDRVVSHPNSEVGHKRKGVQLKLQQNPYGYSIVCVGSTKTVHRLVAKAFIPNPEGKPDINHINGDKKDNRVENLEWCTPQENINHSISCGLKPKAKAGTELPQAKITEEIARWIKYESSHLKTTEVAKVLGIHQSAISRIRNNKRWKHI